MKTDLKKTSILLLCVSVLGLQLLVIAPKIRDLIHPKAIWPFMFYGMYSEAYYPGSSFKILEMKLSDKEGNKMNLKYSDLHIMPNRFRVFMNWAVSDSVKQQEEGITKINYLVKEYLNKNSFSIEIWGKTYVLTREGLEYESVTAELLSGWEVKNGSVEINRKKDETTFN